jgi:hypothetical protein
MADLGPEFRENASIPGSTPGGVIEGVKTAVVVALKQSIQGTTLGTNMSGTDVSVEMEYPMIKEHYPGIWVQFSFTEFMNAGIGMELPFKEDDGNWAVLKEFQFKGTVTMTIMALTNLQRDRISDQVVTMMMYARAPQYVITDPAKDTQQFRTLSKSLASNPYIAMTIDHDSLQPGGQGMTPGVPWDPELPGYEDNYSFSILGQANIVFRHDGTYTLKAIDVGNTKIEPPGRFDWQ